MVAYKLLFFCAFMGPSQKKRLASCGSGNFCLGSHSLVPLENCPDNVRTTRDFFLTIYIYIPTLDKFNLLIPAHPFWERQWLFWHNSFFFAFTGPSQEKTDPCNRGIFFVYSQFPLKKRLATCNRGNFFLEILAHLFIRNILQTISEPPVIIFWPVYPPVIFFWLANERNFEPCLPVTGLLVPWSKLAGNYFWQRWILWSWFFITRTGHYDQCHQREQNDCSLSPSWLQRILE